MGDAVIIPAQRILVEWDNPKCKRNFSARQIVCYRLHGGGVDVFGEIFQTDQRSMTFLDLTVQNIVEDVADD